MAASLFMPTPRMCALLARPRRACPATRPDATARVIPRLQWRDRTPLRSGQVTRDQFRSERRDDRREYRREYRQDRRELRRDNRRDRRNPG